eukprot:CAMPEP_0176430282 /NCGR_PEP_ID=MMETSP0127-20121128/14164_1 /TAXON_ID=938130 /ORGANISM="Platyophrya macrostoma, Strain WH" /LENGTH=171 /DNA_ID=CAMNT_0017812149 /DNA_START=231 /DNA_END=746 /DNA_ORIENTATION=+
MKDGQITELEEAYEELQRQAEFSKGEMETELHNQRVEVEAMSSKCQHLEATVASQSKKLEEVTETLEQYRSMQSMMQVLMSRCQELEAAQRLSEQQDASRREAERKASEEAEAQRIVEEQVRRENERAAQQLQARTTPQEAPRPSPLLRFRPSSAPSQQRPASKTRDCLMM